MLAMQITDLRPLTSYKPVVENEYMYTIDCCINYLYKHIGSMDLLKVCASYIYAHFKPEIAHANIFEFKYTMT